MNERRSDFELLQRFARQGEQSAFADVVRRHLDLVYSTALRKVDDSGAAQEIAQNVFAVLARKAWQFAPDDSLPSWLHRTALLESKSWLRGELRRRRREETAAQLGTTMKTPDDHPAINALVPLLDEALLSLRDRDRTALLLRYYESHSLRDVGAAFGLSEDTAQKRVQAALQKLADFFKRRGFRTASAAALAAALQHTAGSASSTLSGAVVSAALKGAPPALSGFSLLLARLASLTQAQTVTACAVIAIAPVLWQWQRVRETAAIAASSLAQLENVRQQQEQFADDIERLRAEIARLETVRSARNENQGRIQEAARRLAALKARTRAMLADDHYRWPEDHPFVRVPKSAVSEIRVTGGANTPAKLEAKVNDFLDLSPQERDAASQIFSNYFGGLDRLFESNLYETNQAIGLKLPPGAQSKVFVLEPMGENIRAAMDQLCADLSTALGAERWAMIKPEQFEFTHYEQVRLLGYTQYAWDQRQEIAVNIFTDPNGVPTVSWSTAQGLGSSAMSLSALRDATAKNYPMALPQGPPLFVERVRQWIAAEAARLAQPSKP